MGWWVGAIRGRAVRGWWVGTIRGRVVRGAMVGRSNPGKGGKGWGGG